MCYLPSLLQTNCHWLQADISKQTILIFYNVEQIKLEESQLSTLKSCPRIKHFNCKLCCETIHIYTEDPSVQSHLLYVFLKPVSQSLLFWYAWTQTINAFSNR